MGEQGREDVRDGPERSLNHSTATTMEKLLQGEVSLPSCKVLILSTVRALPERPFASSMRFPERFLNVLDRRSPT